MIGGVLQYPKLKQWQTDQQEYTNKDGSVEIVPPPAFTDNILPVDVPIMEVLILNKNNQI